MPELRREASPASAVAGLADVCAFCAAGRGDLEPSGDVVELEPAMLSRIEAPLGTPTWFVCVDRAACHRRRGLPLPGYLAERPSEEGPPLDRPGERTR
ncbi:MAG TPA: hypothetical protein VGJ25_09025 [Gaiellaceae bacterium]